MGRIRSTPFGGTGRDAGVLGVVAIAKTARGSLFSPD
jgi:hypothetical protein